MSNILAMKLVTGEEIIGKTELTLDLSTEIFSTVFIKIEKVRRVDITGDASGRIGLTLVPFMLTNMDGFVSIQTKNIVAVNSDVSKQLQDAYLEHTSGLTLASHI